MLTGNKMLFCITLREFFSHVMNVAEVLTAKNLYFYV